MMADNATVKTEQVAMKMEIDDETNGLQGVPMVTEDDLYEDAGDLEFFDPTRPEFASMYLVRVPPYLWESWDKLDDDTEIQVATLRKWSETAKNGETKHRMRMLLRNDLASHQGIPKEYDLDLPMVEAKGVQNTIVKNTFVFNEQDLPGFKAKNKLRAEAAAAGIPARLLRKEQPDQNKMAQRNLQHWRRGRQTPRQEFFRKAIPKKTTVMGRIRHELNCAPVKNPESDFILNERARAAMVPKAQVKFGDASKPQFRIIGTGGVASHGFATDFIKTAQPQSKAKRIEAKTARMPENELLDLIFACFARFRFWSMRALRAEVPQPEVYLRQTLEKVADLHRCGRFANNWELKAEHRRDSSATAEVKASEFVAETAEAESDEEEELEDVPLPQPQ